MNPDDDKDIVVEWLDWTPLEQANAYHVVARSAFGDLYLSGEQNGCVTTVCCTLHAIFSRSLCRKDAEQLELALPWFFSGMRIDTCDLNDVPMFERALHTLGPLGPNEMHGFEPAMVAGGSIDLPHLRKVAIARHPSILRQLAAPTMPYGNVDIDKLIKDNT